VLEQIPSSSRGSIQKMGGFGFSRRFMNFKPKKEIEPKFYQTFKRLKIDKGVGHKISIAILTAVLEMIAVCLPFNYLFSLESYRENPQVGEILLKEEVFQYRAISLVVIYFSSIIFLVG